MEHTEGDWKVSSSGRRIWVEDIDSDDIHTVEPIAEIVMTNECHQANALLIAAAPGLHTELKGIVKAFEGIGTSAFMAYMYKHLPDFQQALARAEER